MFYGRSGIVAASAGDQREQQRRNGQWLHQRIVPHANASVALPIEDTTRQAQPLARVRVVRADAHAAELGERNLFGRIVEQHDLQRVARILGLDQLGQCQRDAFGRRESILAVENHAVAAIEQEHRRAGALILALHDHEIFVRHRQPRRLLAGEVRHLEGAAVRGRPDGLDHVAEVEATGLEGPVPLDRQHREAGRPTCNGGEERQASCAISARHRAPRTSSLARSR